MNEDELEQLCLNWFRDNNRDITYGPTLPRTQTTRKALFPPPEADVWQDSRQYKQ